jgi:hypothetical protein
VRFRKLNLIWIAAPAILIAGAAATWLALELSQDPAPTLVVSPNTEEDEVADDDTSPAADPLPRTLDDRISAELRRASEPDTRVELLRSLLDEPEATFELPVFSRVMAHDRSADVRKAAFEVSFALALRETTWATTTVLTRGLDSPHPELIREALRKCARHPHPGLANRLLSIASRRDSYRSLAVQALAFLEEPEAQKAVLELASDESAREPDRVRAIVLLSRTTLPEAVTYLQTLAEGDNEEFKQFANAALHEHQMRINRGE